MVLLPKEVVEASNAFLELEGQPHATHRHADILHFEFVLRVGLIQIGNDGAHHTEHRCVGEGTDAHATDAKHIFRVVVGQDVAEANGRHDCKCPVPAQHTKWQACTASKRNKMTCSGHSSRGTHTSLLSLPLLKSISTYTRQRWTLRCLRLRLSMFASTEDYSS